MLIFDETTDFMAINMNKCSLIPRSILYSAYNRIIQQSKLHQPLQTQLQIAYQPNTPTQSIRNTRIQRQLSFDINMDEDKENDSDIEFLINVNNNNNMNQPQTRHEMQQQCIDTEMKDNETNNQSQKPSITSNNFDDNFQKQYYDEFDIGNIIQTNDPKWFVDCSDDNNPFLFYHIISLDFATNANPDNIRNIIVRFLKHKLKDDINSKSWTSPTGITYHWDHYFVIVKYNLLQFITIYYNLLQFITIYYNLLQFITIYYNLLQFI